MGFRGVFGTIVGGALVLTFLKMMACDDPEQAQERARQMFHKGTSIGVSAFEGGVEALSDAVEEHSGDLLTKNGLRLTAKQKRQSLREVCSDTDAAWNDCKCYGYLGGDTDGDTSYEDAPCVEQ